MLETHLPLVNYAAWRSIFSFTNFHKRLKTNGFLRPGAIWTRKSGSAILAFKITGDTIMAKIGHIALLSENQNTLADFYKNTFEMKEVFRHASKAGGGDAIYLSDGTINLAILPARGRKEGLYHFGFQVEDVDETFEQVKAAGGSSEAPKELPRDGRFAEVFIHDPDGTRIDLSAQGWKTV
jgi:catechol 2,3-dioxygenase-like lactoylglutathione lyase family enzyme